MIGASDAHGREPQDRPVTPADLAATIYTLLGIDPHATLTTRPTAGPSRSAAMARSFASSWANVLQQLLTLT